MVDKDEFCDVLDTNCFDAVNLYHQNMEKIAS